MRWFTHGVYIIHICIICTRVYFWACERNCIYVKVNLHMCKYTPPCKYYTCSDQVYICIYIYVFYTYMYFWSCERAANIHPYANVSFHLIIYIQSHGFFCIRSAGQPQIGPHFIWNRDKWRWARFAIHILDSKDATKIHTNIDSLPVHPSVPPSLYPFFSQNCLHILSKVFRSTAKQPTPEVGSIRCGSSRIQRSY